MMCQEHAFSLAVENCQVTLLAQYVRLTYSDITRILNHLLAVTYHATDVGAVRINTYLY